MSDNRKPRVLLVDDEAHVRLYVKTVVASLGFQVVAEAGDGRQALEQFEQHAPDLVLLDLNMAAATGACGSRTASAWRRNCALPACR